MTRRRLLSLCGLAAARLSGQQEPPRAGGMASRGIKAAPRGKPSGLPFHARFTDVAAAGRAAECRDLGPPRTKADYILEAMGCGAAFFDYDNDGWLDILVLSGSRFGDRAAGRLQPPLQKQPRRHLHRRHREGRPVPHRDMAYGVTVGDYNNDGFEDLFITCWGQNVLYRNNGDGTFTEVTKEAGLLQRAGPLRLRLHVRRLRPRRPARPVRLQLPRAST